MEYNLNIYGIGLRYALCIVCGVIGGLTYTPIAMIGIPLLLLSVVFFLEAILAFSPLMYILKKDDSKTAVDDFK